MKRTMSILGIGTLGILLSVSPAAWGFGDPPLSPCVPTLIDPNGFDLGGGRSVVLGQPKGSAITSTVAFTIAGDPKLLPFNEVTDLTIRVEKGGEDLFFRSHVVSFQYGTGDLIACRVLLEFGNAILDDLKLPAKRKKILYTDEAFAKFEPSLVGEIGSTGIFSAITDLRFYIVQ